MCLSQLLTVVSDSEQRDTQYYEKQIDEFRWTGTARILNP
jgi:hypothetical protein